MHTFTCIPKGYVLWFFSSSLSLPSKLASWPFDCKASESFVLTLLHHQQFSITGVKPSIITLLHFTSIEIENGKSTLDVFTVKPMFWDLEAYLRSYSYLPESDGFGVPRWLISTKCEKSYIFDRLIYILREHVVSLDPSLGIVLSVMPRNTQPLQNWELLRCLRGT